MQNIVVPYDWFEAIVLINLESECADALHRLESKFVLFRRVRVIIVPPDEPSPPTRSYPILIATFAVSTAIWTFSPRSPWGTPGRQSALGTLGAFGEGPDSCKDSDSSNTQTIRINQQMCDNKYINNPQ